MNASAFTAWPTGVNPSAFPRYQPRRMAPLGLWSHEDWAIKAYGIQHRPLVDDAPLLSEELVGAAREHVLRLLPLTLEEGVFYKTGFAVLHEGALANWLLFQWWTHDDVWCQILSYSQAGDPLTFKHSTRPVRACVYETAIIWFEQTSWIRNVLSGNPDRPAYLNDLMPDGIC